MGVNEGDRIKLLDGQTLTSQTNTNYALYVFIKNNPDTNQISMMNSSFLGKIIGTVSANTTCQSGTKITMGLSSESGTLYIGREEPTTFSVIGENLGTITCESPNNSIATCSVSNRTISVLPGTVPTDENGIDLIIRESNGNVYTYNAKVKETGISLNVIRGTGYLPQSHNSALTAVIDGLNYGELECESSNPTKATCEIQGSNLVITPLSVGTATITVIEDNGGATATYDATIENSKYELTVAKGTNAIGIGTITATNCTGSNPFTCEYSKNITINIDANTGYTVNSALVGTNISNKTKGTSFNMPAMANGTAVTLTANATKNTYTLTLNKDTNIGSVSGGGSYTYGQSLSSISAIANTGYSFAGWNPSGYTTMPNNNLTLTATSTANTYILRANANQGSITSTTGWTGTGATATKNVSYNAAIGTFPSVARNGYTFAGWFKTTSATTALTTNSLLNTTNATFANVSTAGTYADIYAKWTQVTLSLSASGTYYIDNTLNQTITATKSSNAGTLSVTGCDSTIATCTMSGNVLTIVPKKVGTTTATVKTQYGNVSKAHTITVQPTLIYGDTDVTYSGNACDNTKKRVVYGQPYGTLCTPSARSGYSFAWYKNYSDNNGTITGVGSPVTSATVATETSNTILYGVWTRNTMTCSAVKASSYHYASGTGVDLNAVCIDFCPDAFPYGAGSEQGGTWAGFGSSAYGLYNSEPYCRCYPLTSRGESYTYTIEMDCS